MDLSTMPDPSPKDDDELHTTAEQVGEIISGPHGADFIFGIIIGVVVCFVIGLVLK